jgi:hypothetical protein
MFRLFVVILILGISGSTHAQQPDHAQTAPPMAAQLRGDDLAHHDFMYAGESHDRRIVIVRQGKVSWRYDDPAGRGEISDAVMLSNGNILFAHQFGITEVSPEKKVVWNYDAPAGHEIHTGVPIGNDHVLFVVNGDPPMVQVVNTITGTVEKQFELQVKHPISVHGQFRHVRLTKCGTLIVAHMDLNKVVEYDSDGHELWSFPATAPWGVTPLQNGNILITDRVGVREVTRRGDSAWTFTPSEASGYHFANLQQAWRLPNGNTVMNSWVNEWNTTAEERIGTIQALEITSDKKVVWVLDSWTPPADLGPATTIQFLDNPFAPEDVHFGSIQ